MRRAGLSRMTDDEFEAWMNEPKLCTGCNRVQPRGDFPSSSAHGRFVVRSRCAECMSAYYRRKTLAKRKTPSDEYERQRLEDATRDWDKPFYDHDAAVELGCA